MNSDIKKTVFLLHCIYSIDEGRKSLYALLKTIRKSGNNYNLNVICVCNNDLEFQFNDDFPIHFIKGTNKLNEFSAWHEGFQLIKDQLDDDSILILSNDTILINHPFYNCIDLALFKYLKNDKYQTLDSIVGIKQKLDFTYVKDYISSFLVIINGKNSIEKIMIDILNVSFNANLNLEVNSPKLILSDDNGYELFINNWLTIPGKNSWYKAQELSSHNRFKLQLKANCILLEHSISVRSKNNGIKIFDLFEITRLSYFRYVYIFRKDFLKNRI